MLRRTTSSSNTWRAVRYCI